jgi:hypothetical protein
MDDIRKKLITVNLRHGEVSAPLRARAFAQLIQKVLFLNKDGIDLEGIRASVAKIVAAPNVAERSIHDAILLLCDHERVIEKTKNGKWHLCEARHKEIQQTIERTEQRRIHLLQRHFPASITEKLLRNWFEDACIAFFTEYGDLIVSLLSRGATPELEKHSFELNQILKIVIEKHGLKEHEEQLLAGFEGFIKSSDRQEQEELMNIAQAMIASRFVASDIGGDPLALEEFKMATILLDTNVLFAITLEKNRITKSLEALGGALRIIEANLKFVYPTKEEYENTVAYHRGQIMIAVENFSIDILNGADNLFLRTALARSCVSREDFERFFNEVKYPPKEFSNGTPIALIDDPSIKAMAKDGMKDVKLKREIRVSPSPTRRNRPKGENSVNHDAALVYIVEGERRQKKNFWVLTLDSGMQKLSATRAGIHGLPLWISVEALLQVLAIDSGGTGIDPTDFAPLFSRILDTEYIPSHETYTVEDLCLIVERENRIISLPDEKIKETVCKIRRAILQGKKRNDPELTLIIQREFQGYRLESDEELRKAKADVAEERKAREFVEGKMGKVQDRAIQDRIKIIRGQAAWSLVKIILLALVIGVLVFWGGKWIFARLFSEETLLSIVLALLSLVSIIWRWGKEFAVRWIHAQQEARKEFEEYK